MSDFEIFSEFVTLMSSGIDCVRIRSIYKYLFSNRSNPVVQTKQYRIRDDKYVSSTARIMLPNNIFVFCVWKKQNVFTIMCLRLGEVVAIIFARFFHPVTPLARVLARGNTVASTGFGKYGRGVNYPGPPEVPRVRRRWKFIARVRPRHWPSVVPTMCYSRKIHGRSGARAQYVKRRRSMMARGWHCRACAAAGRWTRIFLVSFVFYYHYSCRCRR